MPSSAMIVDDQADIRTLLRVFINAHEDLAVIGEASSGDEALSMIDELNPDVVVLDHMMPGMTGIEVAREMRARRPDIRIVMCSAYLDDNVIREATEAGVVACVGKMELAKVPQLLLGD